MQETQLAVNCGAICKGNVLYYLIDLVVQDNDLLRYVQGIKSTQTKKVEEMIRRGLPVEF